MTGIFISCRSDDAQPWALLLRDKLTDAFGREHVFVDQDTLPAGSGGEPIQQALDRCKVVVVVMGQKWLTITDAGGERRLDNPDDIHRRQIAFALARKDVTVVPVVVEGAPMPRAAELPDELRSLTDQPARQMSDSSVQRDIDFKVLVTDIERITGLAAKPRTSASSTRPQTVQRKRTPSWFPIGTFAIAAIFSVVLLVITDVWWGWTFDAQETSFIVLIVLLATIGGRWFRHRVTRSKHDET